MVLVAHLPDEFDEKLENGQLHKLVFGMKEFLDGLQSIGDQTNWLVDSRRSLSRFDSISRVINLVGSLQSHKILTDDLIAIFSYNRVEYMETLLAATVGGVRYTPINWHSSAQELSYILSDAAPKALFVDPALFDVASKAIQQSAFRGVVYVYSDHEVVGDLMTVSYETAIESANIPDDVDETVFGTPMFYTSGTTGRPKGVRGSLLPPGTTLANFSAAYNSRIGTPPFGITLLDGPIYHSGQWLYAFLPMLAGSSTAIQGKFDALETLRAIERRKITNIHLVPTQFVRILKLDEAVRESFDYSSLIKVWHGAAPCPPFVKSQIIELFGDCVTEYYGSTELGVNTMISADEAVRKPGSIGKAVPGVDIAILGEDGEPLPRGVPGIIATRSQRSFFYHNEPDKTKSTMIGDNYSTVGDVGYMDEDGYLFISDRKIDMIISGGVNIYPAEIEAVIHGHPDVLDVAVIGIPDDEFGESVLAQVSPVDPKRAGEALTAELVKLCRENLSGYKVPRRIEFVSEIPRSLAGKILKHQIRAPYWSDSSRKI
ncbi:MAG: AMP-binding protein [Actinomycetota bacterium]|nr:AMP-binding protein [Actinomycetota bacterium]